MHARSALLLSLLLACSGPLPEPVRSQLVPRSEADAGVARSELPAEAMVLVTSREALRVIEDSVGSLARLAFSREAQDNAALHRDPAYAALVQVLSDDVAALSRDDPQAGVAIRGHAHRLFDVRWLRAAAARFELVAVANRLDRHFFFPAGCGELRLIYRLAYREAGEAELHSRLPMTLALELRADPADQPGACAAAAQRWLVPPTLTGRALGQRLTAAGGPLSAPQLTRARITQLVTNVQTVRWPSAVRPDLGGHAEYVLRAFAWDARTLRYAPRKLENTPDVRRLARPSLRAQLVRYLSEPTQLAALDSGNIRLPDEYLAESVVSVTPRGLARRANRPFRSLLSPRDFAALPLTQHRLIRSPEALLRRLDDLTCSGCHQSRSIAGFHLLGEDAADEALGNALLTGSSPHQHAEQPRRRAYVQALAAQQAVTLERPFAERARAEDDGYGAHCGLGDPGFASWRCADGLHCDAYEANSDEQTVGVCLPPTASTGDPCEPARVRADRDAHRDGVLPAPALPCPQVCERTRVGFPGGMCAGSCTDMPTHTACGGIAILTPFNECLARARPFSECARAHVRPAGLRACSVSAPCRDDYVCTRGQGEQGVCLPPYFVFQLRVDGHPAPRHAAAP
jgi:hypothetical protein